MATDPNLAVPNRPRNWARPLLRKPYTVAGIGAVLLGIPIVALVSQFVNPKTKTVSVVTEPAGAEIFVDGQKQSGLSNADLTLPLGKRTIRVEKAGYAPTDQEVDISGDASPQRLAFKMVADGTPPFTPEQFVAPPADAASTADATPAAAPTETATTERTPGEAGPVATNPPSTDPVAPLVHPVVATPAPASGDVEQLNQEVEKLKTVVNILLKKQDEYAQKADVQTEVGRLEQEVAQLKAELQSQQVKKIETARPLAKADDDQTQWRAYSGGGTVTITNLMPQTLRVRIAGIDYTVKSGDKATAAGLKAGQVTTEIVGVEEPRVWELAPPNFRQDLVIK